MLLKTKNVFFFKPWRKKNLKKRLPFFKRIGPAPAISAFQGPKAPRRPEEDLGGEVEEPLFVRAVISNLGRRSVLQVAVLTWVLLCKLFFVRFFGVNLFCGLVFACLRLFSFILSLSFLFCCLRPRCSCTTDVEVWSNSVSMRLFDLVFRSTLRPKFVCSERKPPYSHR